MNAQLGTFSEQQESTISAYEIVVTVNQLSGFNYQVDELLAQLIQLLQQASFINAELPEQRFSEVLQRHMRCNSTEFVKTLTSSLVKHPQYLMPLTKQNTPK